MIRDLRGAGGSLNVVIGWPMTADVDSRVGSHVAMARLL
jgi:hypothetical protein